jgi:cell division protein FtsI/penicillin-binding protein 2
VLQTGQRLPWIGLVMACVVSLGARAAAVPSRVEPRAVTPRNRTAPGLFHPALGGSSIDPELQLEAGRLLAAAHPVAGGVVMVHAPTGRILAWQEYRRDRARSPSLVTRALAPSASVFKIVTSVALLSRGSVAPSERICVRGGEHGIQREHLERASDPRAVCRRFDEALGFSVNAVFAQLVTERLMRKDLLEVAGSLGFNRALDFELPAEVGTVTAPYDDLGFARTSIGARGTRLSVLGAAHLVYTIANGGLEPRMTLRLPRAPPDPRGVAPAPAPRLVDAAIARQMRRMLEVTVHSGTSLGAFTDEHGMSYLGDIRVAGKTGTLQTDPAAPMTSWFAGFAPSTRPEVVVSVLLQNGPVWRTKANALARDLLRVYFKGRRGVSAPPALAIH